MEGELYVAIARVHLLFKNAYMLPADVEMNEYGEEQQRYLRELEFLVNCLRVLLLECTMFFRFIYFSPSARRLQWRRSLLFSLLAGVGISLSCLLVPGLSFSFNS